MSLLSHRLSRLAVLAVSVFLSADLAEAQVLTLESLETTALDDHPQLGQRRAELRVAEARIDATRAEMRPSLYLDLGVTAAPGMQLVEIDEDGDRETTTDDRVFVSGTRGFGQSDRSPFQPFFRYSGGLRFSGPLYDFGRNAARVDAAEAEAAAVGAQADVARETLVRETRTAYLRWLGAYEQRRIAEAAEAIAQTRASQVEESVRMGVRPGADRDVAAYEVARLRLLLARARADEDDLRAALALATRVEIPDEAIPDVEWLEPVATDVPLPTPAAIAAIELQRTAVGASLRAYRRRHNPVLSISVGLGLAAQEADGGLVAFPNYSIQVGLSMPLWDPRLGSQLRREMIARDEALAESEANLRVQVESERARARIAAVRASEQVELATEASRLATSIATNVEDRYRAAGGSLDGVLNARQREISASTDLLTARLALAIARMRLRPVPEG